MNFDILASEINTDPLGRGYVGMTDVQVMDSLNTVNRTRPKDSLTPSEVLNAIDGTERAGLTAAEETKMWNVLHLGGNLNPYGVEADIFIEIFGGGSATITTLQALRLESISRATELGLPVIREGDVIFARTL